MTRPSRSSVSRVSNALISDESTEQLLRNLDDFKSNGVNTVSVFLMGSRFGDIKGYKPDGSLDPVYASRLAKIIEAADERGSMVVFRRMPLLEHVQGERGF